MKVTSCKYSKFNGIKCLESELKYGFFKDKNDKRPSNCIWISKDKLKHLLKILENKNAEV